MAQRGRALTRALGPAYLFSPSALFEARAGVAPQARACAAPRDAGLKHEASHGVADLSLPWPAQELWLRGRPDRFGFPVLAESFHSSPAPGAVEPSAGRGDATGEAQQGSGAPSAASGAASPSSGTSWLGKVQSLVWGQGKGSGGSEQDQWSVATALDAFAKQLAQAQTFGALAKFGRGLPQGGEASITASLKQQKDIALALASLLRPSTSPFSTSPARPLGSGSNLQLAPDGSVPAIPKPLKESAAMQAGCTVVEVDNFLHKFSWFCQASAKMEALKAQGKPAPRTFQEVEELMGGSWPRGTASGQAAAPSRNSACPCGSGKKFKRCCGAAAA